MLLQILILTLLLIVVIGGIALYLMNQQTAKKNRMLQVIQGRSGPTVKRDKGGSDQDKRRAEIAKKLRDEKEDAGGKKKKASVALMLEQAGLKTSAKQFWILSFATMFALLALGKAMAYPPHMIMMLGVIGLLGLPRFILKKMIARRQKNFLQEFPDALEATVRLLRAGMPVAEAISMIAREFDGPVGEEMSRIYDKQKIGIALHEAALEATRRMPLTEMQMFATGLSIQAQTGSSLSEVLMNLSGVIRARFRLKRKVKALSSEAVASASIIGALPVLVSTGLYFVNYEYLEVLFITPFGNILITFAVGMMLLGCFIMKIMINFKI
jgi:tight adherence protein B